MERPSYKCIKHYPSGPEVGYILKPQNGHWNNVWYWYMNNWFNPEEFPEYWELVKEPIMVTEDGVEIFDELTYIYSVYRKSNCTYTNYCKYSMNLSSDWARFSSDKKRTEWIEENKPQYSKKDMIEFAKCSRLFNENKSSEEYFIVWKNSVYNLKNNNA